MSKFIIRQATLSREVWDVLEVDSHPIDTRLIAVFYKKDEAEEYAEFRNSWRNKLNHRA